MSDNEDCKACETMFAAHQDERPAILLSQLNALHSKYTLHVAGHVLTAAEERGRRRGVGEAATAIDAKRAATQGDDTFTTYYRGGLADAARIVRAALAPRDSGKEGPFTRDECPFNYCDQESPYTACVERCRYLTEARK